MKNILNLSDGTNKRVIINGRIKYIRVRGIKIVQYFVVLIKPEDGIWASVDLHGRLVVGIHGNFELTAK